MEANEFVQLVEAAFPDDGCPEEWLPSCECDECLELKKFLQSKPSWKTWNGTDCRWAYTISLMGESFKYFLPAYMVALFNDSEEADVAIEGSVWEFLHRDMNRGTPQLFSSFNQSQRELILVWLGTYLTMFDGSVKERACFDYLQGWHNDQPGL